MNKKYALCIGNNYPGTSAQLSGCVNDAWDWSALLTGQGYQVEVLLEASLVETVIKLAEMVEKARFGDRIVFTYSGHGSWIPDRSGDESDGRDEVLVMSDYMQGGLLADDELQRIFGNLRYGARALILSDSCHSGTVSRFSSEVRGEVAKPRFLSPALFTSVSEARVSELEANAASKPRPTASLVSGCGDLEYSYDAWFGGRANGAFTRAAIDQFFNLGGQPSLNTWFKGIRHKLPSERYPQSPELTASRYRKYTRAL